MEIEIDGFDPLSLKFPKGVTEFSGEVRLVLPEVTVIVADVSMGGALPGNPCLASKGKMAALKLTLPEPVGVGKLTEMIVAVADKLEECHRIFQTELSKRPLITL